MLSGNDCKVTSREKQYRKSNIEFDSKMYSTLDRVVLRSLKNIWNFRILAKRLSKCDDFGDSKLISWYLKINPVFDSLIESIRRVVEKFYAKNVDTLKMVTIPETHFKVRFLAKEFPFRSLPINWTSILDTSLPDGDQALISFSLQSSLNQFWVYISILWQFYTKDDDISLSLRQQTIKPALLRALSQVTFYR